MVSLAAWPGSRKCTCRSIKPGQTTSPETSMRSISGVTAPALGPTAAIFPSRIRTSAMTSEWLAGSMTRPPARSSEFIRANITRAPIQFNRQSPIKMTPGAKMNRRSAALLFLSHVFVQVIRRADEAEVGKRLGKVAQLFAREAQFFRIQAQVVGVAEVLFKVKPGLLHVAGAGQTLHIPKRAHGKCSLTARESRIGSRQNVVPIDERVLHRVSLI